MPETTQSLRACVDCGETFDDTYEWGRHSEFQNHYTTCAQISCQEHYCSEQSECPYCNGNGFPDEDDEDDYEYNGRTGIYSYDYKPSPLWHGGRDKPYYLGFELEISAERFDTRPISNWCDDNGHEGMLYCKEDGSVDGFEIVSHPMTPEYFDSVNWASFFEMLEMNWPLHGRDENIGHGLHVHVSRTAFQHTSTLARWSYLLNHYRDHTCRVARRRDSNWARFTDYPVSALLPYEARSGRNGHWENGTEPLPCVCGNCYERIWREESSPQRITRQFQTRVRPERYQAVNLTNDATVEIRVFRSTRKPEEFISSLHFVTATVDFVRTMQPWHATRLVTQWDTFTEYVSSHPVFSKESAVLAGVPCVPPNTATGIGRGAIRQWARDNGYAIGTRGRIASHIQAAYLAASAI